MPSERVAVRGSERLPVPNSQVAGTPDPNWLITVTLILRRQSDDLPAPGSKRLSREEFEAQYGANPDDIPLIEVFAEENDLTVGNIDLSRRTVALTGTVAN